MRQIQRVSQAKRRPGTVTRQRITEVLAEEEGASMSWKEWLNKFSDIDPSVTLKYSLTTEKFYVSTRLEKQEKPFLVGICEHREEPEDAVWAFRDAIKGEVLVDVGHSSGTRREYAFT